MSWQHDPEKLKVALRTDRVLGDGRVRSGNGSSKHKRRMREVLLEVHGPLCWLCARPIVNEEPTLDHVVPHSKGGRNAIANMRLAHERCNRSRGNGPVPELLLTKAMRLAPRSKPNGRDRETGLGAKHESGNQRPNIGNYPTKPVE